MFTSPITITIGGAGGTDKVLNRISESNGSSVYLLREAAGEYRLTIRHSSFVDKSRGNTKMDRHSVELLHTIYPVAPATVATVRKMYTVSDIAYNDVGTPPVDFQLGLVGFLTEANLEKLNEFAV